MIFLTIPTYLEHLYLRGNSIKVIPFIFMSIRIRNGKTYYRYTVWDKEAKKYRYLERKSPIVKEPTLLTTKAIGQIFARFPEPSSSAIVLHLIYYYDFKVVDIYKLKISQVDFRKNALMGVPLRTDTIRLLKRHIERIRQISDGYLIVDLRTGKKLSHHQLEYIVKVVRKEIDPSFSIKNFKSHKNPFSI